MKRGGIDEGKVKVLIGRGWSDSGIARLLGCRVKDVSRIREKEIEDIKGKVDLKIVGIEDNLVKDLEYAINAGGYILRQKIGEIIEDRGKYEEISLRDIVWVMDKMIEKLRLIKGESTKNIATVSKFIIDAHKEIKGVIEDDRGEGSELFGDTEGGV